MSLEVHVQSIATPECNETVHSLKSLGMQGDGSKGLRESQTSEVNEFHIHASSHQKVSSSDEASASKSVLHTEDTRCVVIG